MTKRIIFIVLILALASISCKTPSLVEEILQPEETTPQPSATPAPTATPTPTPTPIPAVRINQADEILFLGDYQTALTQYQIALVEAGDSETQAAAMVGIGRTQYLSRNYNPAIQSLRAVIENYPESPYLRDAYFFLGECSTALENYQAAADAYQGYLSLGSTPIDSYILELRGDALSIVGSQTEALSAYQAAYDAPRLGNTAQLGIKIGDIFSALQDYDSALNQYWNIYENAPNDYVKAQVNYVLGRTYLDMGIPEQAYARFQESVTDFPLSYYAYLGLIELVNNGVEVNQLDRGLVDYFANQHGVAIEAFTQYMDQTPDHDATALHYQALSLLAIGESKKAIENWTQIIENFSGDRFWTEAWSEKAYAQWAYEDNYRGAASTLLEFVERFPTYPEAPGYLFDAARIQERNNQLLEAAGTWERMMDEYPAADQSYRGLFLAGVTYYRLSDYPRAQTIFQRALVLGTTAEDQAAAYLWIGKTQQAQNKYEEARTSWEQAAHSDPTGYYSERARGLLEGNDPFQASALYDLDYDLIEERQLAEGWIRNTFAIADDVTLSGLSDLAGDPRVQRGNAYWQLGLFNLANAEFEALRLDILDDPINNFRLLQHLVDLGFYRQAIFTSRQILTLANMDDAATLTAPDYFNHIRFGAYYKEQILKAAEEENFHPLFLLSTIRQESLFDGLVQSSAGAIGLMQIVPSTGQEIASQLNWPPNYTDSDLNRPIVNITMGTHYLSRQRDYFDGSLYQALAGYNAGPGNAQIWNELAGGDPDLFLEIIRYDETRSYIEQITEFMNLYRRFYDTTY